MTNKSKMLLFASLSFDAATAEWLNPLLKGATLYIASDEQKQSVEHLQNLLVDKAITHATLPPALLELMDVNRDYALQSLTVAGENCDQQLAQRWLAKYRLFNGYGPTENTIAACVSQLDASGAINIGRAMDNVQLYVLDKHLELQPTGSIGELYIGGAGLARGYHNRPDLTAKTFIENPFSSSLYKMPSRRLYKTGDYVRYLPDGNLQFMGRVDEQVKIRGLRIELGEIERQLSLLPGVQSAVVLAREDQPGQKLLVAYFTCDIANQALDFIAQLRQQLKVTLPEFMVPSLFVKLDEMPLTPNDKIDKKALPKPDASLLMNDYVTPANPTEQQLVSIWSDLLKIDADKLSVTGNFFELGGHSLLMTSMLHAIVQQLDVQLSVKSVFVQPTIRGVAGLVDDKQQLQTTPLVHLDNQGVELPLSYGQYRVWFIEQLKDHTNEHNMPFAINIKGEFNAQALEAALNFMIKRHEILRTRFYAVDGEPVQLVEPSLAFKVAYYDLSEGALSSKVPDQA
ncbi:MAG: AMP-binding protein, partial [Psychrosphaera sp.]|nr:AMP-binding protein [Psychrosphaera sp.]